MAEEKPNHVSVTELFLQTADKIMNLWTEAEVSARNNLINMRVNILYLKKNTPRW